MMGKKKKAKHDREAKPHHAGEPRDSAPLAGIAAAVARQIATPAGRQMIAAGLVAAAGAIAGGERGPGARPMPVPPQPPVAPTPPAPHLPEAARKPAFDTPPLTVPPEAAQVIGAAAAALERWVQGLAKPPKPPGD